LKGGGRVQIEAVFRHWPGRIGRKV